MLQRVARSVERQTTVARRALCYWMGRDGHFTLAWTPDEDEKAEQLIQQAMDRGVVFRIMPRGPFDRNPTELDDIADVPEDRKLVIDDADVRRFLAVGAAAAVAAELPEAERAAPMPRARTAREVRENDTVAHRPLAGG